MSYILDALKRAESERARERLPDIHAPAGVLAHARAPRTARVRPVVWITVGLAAGLAVAAAMHFAADRATGTGTSATLEATTGGSSPPVVAGAVAQAPAATQARSPAMAMPSDTPTRPQIAAPPVESPTASPASSAYPAAAPAPFLPPPATRHALGGPVPSPSPSPVTLASPAPGPGATQSVGRPAASAPAASSPVLAHRDLPESVRRQLPALRLSGSIYSDRRADRLLIVDGQLAREGDEVAPGLVLEQIGQRAAVFRQGTLRFELPL